MDELLIVAAAKAHGEVRALRGTHGLRLGLVNDAPVGPFPQTGSKQARGQQAPRSGYEPG